MKRRDVLKVGAIGGAAAATAVGGPGCAVVPKSVENAGPRAASFNASLDRVLGLADKSTVVSEFVESVKPGPKSDAARAMIAEHDVLMRKTVRALFVTQSFRDLDPEVQLHPDVQDRVASHLDEIEDSIFSLTSFLDRQTPAQRSKVRDALKKHPDAAMRIAEEVDRRLADTGMSPKRRNQLRTMMRQVTFRLKTESPGAIIDEYTAKVHRLRGVDGDHALAMKLAEKLGERHFWKYEKYLQQTAPGAGPAGGMTQPVPQPQSQPAPPMQPMQPMQPPPGQAPMYQPMQPPQPRQKRGRKAVRAGAYMLGIGLIVGLISALIAAGEGDAAILGLFGLTAGALLISIGFIVLIIGAIAGAAD